MMLAAAPVPCNRSCCFSSHRNMLHACALILMKQHADRWHFLPLCRCGTAQVCKYIDIPLQHISNLTLLAMNRPPQAHTVTLLHKLRDRIPDLALRTTFISGFPGGCWCGCVAVWLCGWWLCGCARFEVCLF